MIMSTLSLLLQPPPGGFIFVLPFVVQNKWNGNRHTYGVIGSDPTYRYFRKYTTAWLKQLSFFLVGFQVAGGVAIRGCVGAVRA